MRCIIGGPAEAGPYGCECMTKVTGRKKSKLMGLTQQVAAAG